LPCLDYGNGLLPRRILGRSIPNGLKIVGHEDVLFGLKRYLQDFDLVHVPEQTFYFSWQAAHLKEQLGFRLVVTQDESVPFWYAHFPWVMRRASYVRERADRFIARSHRAKLALIAEGVSGGKIDVVGHGVDTDRFCPGPPDLHLRRSLNLTANHFVVLFAGQLLWTKGVFSFADAAQRLLQDLDSLNIQPVFVMVGEGNDRSALVRRLRMFGIEDHFRLIGAQPYHLMPALHRLADVFVLPSISTRYIIEQFGIVLIESMATGKPVIATRCGAIDEVVGDAAILIQPNDTYRLHEAILTLCREPGLRRQLGARGRQRVLDRFSRESVSRALAGVYSHVMGLG
jgi:glycosyltransferase involved in cell wall biosynthesis